MLAPEFPLLLARDVPRDVPRDTCVFTRRSVRSSKWTCVRGLHAELAEPFDAHECCRVNRPNSSLPYAGVRRPSSIDRMDTTLDAFRFVLCTAQ